MIITSPTGFYILIANLKNYDYVAKTLIKRCINVVQRCIDIVSTSGTVENLTSDFVSFSTSDECYFDVDPQRSDNVDPTSKC